MASFSPKAVAQAIERELAREGQVFFVHNRVQDIGKMAAMVGRLVPGVRVAVAHGQLPEKELERVMLSFVRRELDVLVCTTIIESGLDIPSANTIIINNADKFGLSQIYQLRGRVGRSERRAYAYLFVRSEASLSRQAAKRLKALMDFTQLGAGFSIAMHDLQIRGAGNMLGEAQSGVAAEVGYELYLRMLEEAIARLKGEAPPEGPEPELAGPARPPARELRARCGGAPESVPAFERGAQRRAAGTGGLGDERPLRRPRRRRTTFGRGGAQGFVAPYAIRPAGPVQRRFDGLFHPYRGLEPGPAIGHGPGAAGKGAGVSRRPGEAALDDRAPPLEQAKQFLQYISRGGN